MRPQEAKEKGFTHMGYIYGIVKIYAVYYDGNEHPVLMEASRFYGIMFDVFGFFDRLFWSPESITRLDLREITWEDSESPNNEIYNILGGFIVLAAIFIYLKYF